MSNQFQNSNLVIKNGFFLFFRLILVLFLGFFSTRLSLQVLGDEKFGIYNIVGGIIAIFAIISMPVRDSLQRFFNVEFTEGNRNPSIVFFTSVRIVKWMIIIITILYESIGLYLINSVIKYPIEERFAVNVIFQLSVVANIYGFAALPYLSLLFSKENMGIPAICEIISAIIKIVLIYLIPYIPVDVLIPYAGIFLITNWLQYFFYRMYSKKYYSECFLNDNEEDKVLRKNMLSFSGWSFVEAVAGITITYVSNVFINIFGGVLYNTAYGLSKQLQNAVSSFASNVLKASDPQITSNTAAGNIEYRNQLVMTTAKISFIGIAFVYVLFHFDGFFLLGIWLESVPNYTLEFCDIALLTVVFGSISLPYRTLIMATGNVKGYFLTYGFVSIVSMVIMYILLSMGYPIITAMYIILACSIIMMIVAIVFSVKLSSIDVRQIIKNILLPGISIVITALVYYIVRTSITASWFGFVAATFSSMLVLLITSYWIGFTESEKNKFSQIVKVTMNRVTNR